MPARSQKQQGIMGMALALKRGKVKKEELPKGVRNKVASIASDMTDEQLSHYTSTPRSEIPKTTGRPPRGRVRVT